jgi:hypothetical protein
MAKIGIILGCLALGLFLALLIFSPMRLPPSIIRNSFLREVPLGTALPDLEHYLINERHLVVKVSKGGFYMQEPPARSKIVGAKTVSANLGTYTSIFLLETSVKAFFGLDENDCLIEIWIWKTVDAP